MAGVSDAIAARAVATLAPGARSAPSRTPISGSATACVKPLMSTAAADGNSALASR
jgi:hypothetical protein